MTDNSASPASHASVAVSELVERLKARRDETLAALPEGVRRATAQWVFDQEIAFLGKRSRRAEFSGGSSATANH